MTTAITPCRRRPLRDQRAAELAWARRRQIDPAGSADLAIAWCEACWAYHLVRKPRPLSRADERPIVRRAAP
jgi:hypothetical protein